MGKFSYQEKQQRKLEKQAQMQTARKKDRMQNIALWTGGVAVIVAVLGGLFFLLLRAEQERPGQFFPQQGQEHVSPNSDPPYQWSSNPPTSGWHYGNTVPAEIYEDAVDPGFLIHNMEHGHVIIWHKPDVPEEELTQIANLVESKRLWKIVVTPYVQMDTNWALTAWEYLDTFDTLDLARVGGFIDAHRNRGPEKTPE